MQISLTFLGYGVPTNGFRKPGAFHHAWWMAKVVYAIKIWLFRSQFHLTRAEIDGLRRFCLFATVVYARYWFEAPVASEASLTDRRLLGHLELIKELVPQVATVATRAICRHLCTYQLRSSLFPSSASRCHSKRRLPWHARSYAKRPPHRFGWPLSKVTFIGSH